MFYMVFCLYAPVTVRKIICFRFFWLNSKTVKVTKMIDHGH